MNAVAGFKVRGFILFAGCLLGSVGELGVGGSNLVAHLRTEMFKLLHIHLSRSQFIDVFNSPISVFFSFPENVCGLLISLSDNGIPTGGKAAFLLFQLGAEGGYLIFMFFYLQLIIFHGGTVFFQVGNEVLEESEFDPMFTGIESALKDKKIALFGSFGWGDGEWMRNWEDRCKAAGANLVCESVMVNDAPDSDGVENCKKLGVALAS